MEYTRPEAPEETITERLLQSMANAKLGVLCVRTFDQLLQQTALHRLWAQQTDARGCRFTSFADFLVHPSPQGLGVRTIEHAEIIQRALRGDKFAVVWAEILEKIGRKRGRQPKNHTNGRNFLPFYPLTGGQNGRDRTLLTLRKHHPELLQAVADGQLSPHAAALQAGLPKKVDQNVGALVRQCKLLNLESKLQFVARLFRSLNRSEFELVAGLLAKVEAEQAE